MGLFLSTSIHKIDKKGRVSVPALFRSALEKESFRGVALAPPLEELACVEGSGLSRIERIAASLDKMNPLEQQHAALATAIMARVRPVPFDGEGRIILPEEFIALARLDGQALFAGLGANFQIWNPATFEAHQAEALKIARANAGALPWNSGGDSSTNSG